MTLRQRKKQLIKELISKDASAAIGRKLSSFVVLLTSLLRIAQGVYELVFFALTGVDASILAYLIFLLELIVLYMISDGNKPLSTLVSLSAALRVVYLFSKVHPALTEGVGTNVYLITTVLVFAFQFIGACVIGASRNTEAYEKLMKRVNLQIQKEFLMKK